MIKFSTETGESLSMFEKEAVAMIKAMGMSGNVPGAVKAENIVDALQSLKSALNDAPESDREDNNDDAAENKSVDSSTRAFPLIELLTRSAEKNEAVMWEKN